MARAKSKRRSTGSTFIAILIGIIILVMGFKGKIIFISEDYNWALIILLIVMVFSSTYTGYSSNRSLKISAIGSNRKMKNIQRRYRTSMIARIVGLLLPIILEILVLFDVMYGVTQKDTQVLEFLLVSMTLFQTILGWIISMQATSEDIFGGLLMIAAVIYLGLGFNRGSIAFSLGEMWFWVIIGGIIVIDILGILPFFGGSIITEVIAAILEFVLLYWFWNGQFYTTTNDHYAIAFPYLFAIIIMVGLLIVVVQPVKDIVECKDNEILIDGVCLPEITDKDICNSMEGTEWNDDDHICIPKIL